MRQLMLSPCVVGRQLCIIKQISWSSCPLTVDKRSMQVARSQQKSTGKRSIGASAHQAPPKDAEVNEGLPAGFADRQLRQFRLAIVGDLHIVPEQMHHFRRAQQQLSDVLALSSPQGACSRLVQLGDLGGYDVLPGSRGCFETAKAYLSGFNCPQALITGNHDLEGAEFETDEENLQAWVEVFQQRHYWAVDVGPATFIGLSTVRFRSNPDSVHEVHIDDDQMAWFKSLLSRVGSRPVIMFTHAPPMGCGLKVLPTVHVKNRCAWLNHSSKPGEFIDLVHQHPNIRLWFSGHYHLSQDYPDSLAQRAGCVFASTNVIGDYNRDGVRQSRVLFGDASGFQLHTLDHDSGELRLDLQQAWQEAAAAQDAAAQPGSPAAGAAAPAAGAGAAQWVQAGEACLLSLQPIADARGDRVLVEHDAASGAPVGVVLMKVQPGERVALLDAQSVPVHIWDGAVEGAAGAETAEPARVDGAVAVELWGVDGTVQRRRERNSSGTYFHVYQPNKWRLQKEKEAALAAA